MLFSNGHKTSAQLFGVIELYREGCYKLYKCILPGNVPLMLCGHGYQQMYHYNMLVAACEMKQEQYQELLHKALHSYGNLFQAFCQLLSAMMSSTCVLYSYKCCICIILHHELTNSSSLVFISDISKHISSITNV